MRSESGTATTREWTLGGYFNGIVDVEEGGPELGLAERVVVVEKEAFTAALLDEVIEALEKRRASADETYGIAEATGVDMAIDIVRGFRRG